MTRRTTDDVLAARCTGRRIATLIGAACLLAAAGPCLPDASAQESWNPFAEKPVPGSAARRPARPPVDPRQRPPMAPMDGVGGEPWKAPEPRPAGVAGPAGPEGDAPATATYAPRPTVEKSDLAPLPGPEGAEIGAAASPTMPGPAAPGPEVAELARRLAGVPMPVRSAALMQLLLRIAGPDDRIATMSGQERAVRAEVLYRAGRIGDVAALFASREVTGDPLLASIAARLSLTRGETERACREAQAALQGQEGLPRSMRGLVIGIQGYCGAVQGNAAAASLAAGLAREDRSLPGETLAALDAIGIGAPALIEPGRRIGVLDWRLAELGAAMPQPIPFDRLEPALLAGLVESSALTPAARIGAAEAAARISAIDASALLEVYRKQPFTAGELAQALTVSVAPDLRRALLVSAAVAERTPFKRTRLVRAALDDAKRAGIYVPVAIALARTVTEIKPVQEIGWFSETAIEIMIAAGRYDEARRWAQAGADQGSGLVHWLGLVDIADPDRRSERGASFVAVEELALRGRFTPDGLHRLATVLDALDYHVPMRLWEAASRSPQPTTGHLPATGVLSELQDAAKRKDLPGTVALVFQTLGAQGPEGAHMIALGDAIRALRRAGLEREARAVAAEALFQLWPRATSS